MKKKLIVTCPCGYRTTIFTDEIEAVSIIQLHIEKFHKDALPFGITTAEALTLLREDYRETRIQPNQRQIESSYGLRDRASLQNKKRGNPILYDMENPIS